MESLLSFVKDPESAYIVVFEDDGKAAYAYLRNDDGIIGEVWLYNSGPTPDEPEWPDRSKMPYANPKGFASEEARPTVRQASDVSVRWIKEHGDLKEVEVMLNGELYGRLAPGAKPGWARLAARKGPCALPLDSPTLKR